VCGIVAATPRHRMPPEPGWVHRAQITILEAAEVLLDWLWFAIASSSASFATVNPLLLQQNTGAPARAPRAVVLCCVVCVLCAVVRRCPHHPSLLHTSAVPARTQATRSTARMS
jgi:hypothetical protein